MDCVGAWDNMTALLLEPRILGRVCWEMCSVLASFVSIAPFGVLKDLGEPFLLIRYLLGSST